MWTVFIIAAIFIGAYIAGINNVWKNQNFNAIIKSVLTVVAALPLICFLWLDATIVKDWSIEKQAKLEILEFDQKYRNVQFGELTNRQYEEIGTYNSNIDLVSDTSFIKKYKKINITINAK